MVMLICARLHGPRPARTRGSVHVAFDQQLGPWRSTRWRWAREDCRTSRCGKVGSPRSGALRPRLIRLFVQEYFQLLPARGHDHFETLDRSVDTILKTGAKPLMCLCMKPRVLFPAVDHDHGRTE